MQCQSFTLRLEHSADLERLNRFLAEVMPIQVSSSLVAGNPSFWSVLVFYEGSAPKAAVEKPAPSPKAPPPSGVGGPTLEALKRWRSEKAKADNVPLYVVAHNAELEAIAQLRPKNLAELGGVKGFGRAKLDKYGKEILEVLNHLE